MKACNFSKPSTQSATITNKNTPQRKNNNSLTKFMKNKFGS